MGGKGEEVPGEMVGGKLHEVGSGGGEEWKEILAVMSNLTPATAAGDMPPPGSCSRSWEESVGFWQQCAGTRKMGRKASLPAAGDVTWLLLTCFVKGWKSPTVQWLRQLQKERRCRVCTGMRRGGCSPQPWRQRSTMKRCMWL